MEVREDSEYWIQEAIIMQNAETQADKIAQDIAKKREGRKNGGGNFGNEE